jgi:hypothetical protein
MKKIFLLLLVVMSFASCTTTKKTTPSGSLNFQININMSDLEYIGDATGTSTQNYVLGIPLGGRKYKVGTINQTFNLGKLKSRGLNNAMYDALKSRPDADFVLPISYERVKNQMFMGSKVTLTIKTKVFKIKAK